MSAGILRHPRCVIAVGGAQISPIECEVKQSQHQSADTFDARLALDDPSGLDEMFWSDTAKIDVTISATNDLATSGFTQMFTGSVDKVDIDLDERTVHICGRDKTAKMVDAKTNEKWLNKQPQDIIQDLAGRSGLGVQFSGTSSDRAGLKYKDDYNRISELDSHWNVIVRLAKQLGCIAFVKGDTLNIQPWDSSQGGSFTIFYQRPTPASHAEGSVVKLNLCRDLNLAKKVKINHKSWQHKQGQGIESEFESDGAGSDTLEYSFKGANLTKQQQDAIARSRVDEITSHERTISIDAPGDVTIDPSMMLVLTGTGTAFDQPYVISDIEHRWGWGEGYRMSVRVRNRDSKRGKAKQNK